MEKAPFLIIEQPYEIAINLVVQQIRNLGFQVSTTFDLQDAIHSHANCACPNHGAEQCNCQLVIILVYGHGPKPATLIAHGNEEKTWFSFVGTISQHTSLHLETLILHTFRLPEFTQHPADATFIR